MFTTFLPLLYLKYIFLIVPTFTQVKLSMQSQFHSIYTCERNLIIVTGHLLCCRVQTDSDDHELHQSSSGLTWNKWSEQSRWTYTISAVNTRMWQSAADTPTLELLSAPLYWKKLSVYVNCRYVHHHYFFLPEFNLNSTHKPIHKLILPPGV